MNNESLDQLWDLIESGKKGNNIGIRTGLPKLDKLIGGIQPSRYILVSAASSVGKTSLVIYMMYHILRNENPDKPVYFLYFSLEIGSDILLSKLMSLYCAEEFGVYMSTNDIFSFDSPISDYQYNCVQESIKWLNSISKYLIIKDESLTANKMYLLTLDTLEEIGLKSDKKWTGNKDVQLIGVVDHISLLRPGKEGVKGEIDMASSYMVSLKRKYKMSWFVLAQQNRSANDITRVKEGLQEPGLSDIKDSSNSAQDADVVIQLFYPFREQMSSYRGYKICGENGLKDCYRGLILSKNRYGVANKRVSCLFYGSVGWFKDDLPKPELIQNYSDYTQERLNIPCKNRKIEKDVKVEDKQEMKVEPKTIIYEF